MESETDTKTTPTAEGGAFHLSGPRIPLGGLLLFLAAAGLVAVIILSLVIGIRLSGRVNDLEEQVPGLTGGLASEDSQAVLNALLQLRVVSYWLAYPSKEPFVLEPPSGSGNEQGVLRIAEDGRSAILMVVGLNGSATQSVYQVWLMSEGERTRAGQVQVDATGWGATTLYPTESLFDFDRMEITAGSEGTPGSASGAPVLEGSITP